MPAFYTAPQVITLLPSGPWPNRPHVYPREKEIDRYLLLDVAPDREALFMSEKGVEELRQVLKIRVGSVAGHWLYRRRKRVNASLRDGNARISTLMRGGPPTSNEVSHSKKEVHVLRRVLSTSSVSAFSNPMMALDSRSLRAQSYGDQDIDIWGTVTLSSAEKLISPRPLGPTHILIIHCNPGPSCIYQPVTGGGRRPLRRKLSSPLSRIVELPINDLLFVLNIPNLSPTLPILPPRLHKELPRVLMYVPHLETFPELVVYLHTHNQAELFRSLVPEWIRDLMHPPPDLTPPIGGRGTTLSLSDSRNIAKVPLQLFGMLLPGGGSDPGVENPDPTYHDVSTATFEYRRTAKSVAEEIAEAAEIHAFSESDDPDTDPILHTVALLNALRDNLEYIGYFGHGLWHELDVYRDVLVRAIS
ncbi:hypothetical protein FPV67DRAFT_1389167, partial [Lyophyllum atratum]